MKWPWRREPQGQPEPQAMQAVPLLVVPEMGPWIDVAEYATVHRAAIGDNAGRRGNYVAYAWGPLVVGWQHTN